MSQETKALIPTTEKQLREILMKDGFKSLQTNVIFLHSLKTDKNL